MKPRITIRRRADRDLDGHAEYIARHNPQAAIRFYQAAESTFQKLRDMPGLGSPCEFSNSALPGLRVWPVQGFENHLIFFQADEEAIVIVRVLHGAQDIEGIFEM